MRHKPLSVVPSKKGAAEGDSPAVSCALSAGSVSAAALEGIEHVEGVGDTVRGELTETKQVLISDGTIEEKATVIDMYSGTFELSDATKRILGVRTAMNDAQFGMQVRMQLQLAVKSEELHEEILKISRICFATRLSDLVWRRG